MEPTRELDVTEPQDRAALEAVALRRVQARMGFAVHLIMFLAVNVGLILIWRFTGGGYPWFVWPLMGWGVLLIVHGVVLLVGPDTVGEDRAVEREIRRLRSHPHEPHLR